MQPLFYWIMIIAVFVALLIVRGGFQRPLVYVVVPVLLLSVLAAFFFFRQPAKSDGSPKASQHEPRDGEGPR